MGVGGGLARGAGWATVLAAAAPAGVAARDEARLAAAAADLLGFGPGDGPRRAADVLAVLPDVDALVERLVVGAAE